MSDEIKRILDGVKLGSDVASGKFFDAVCDVFSCFGNEKERQKKKFAEMNKDWPDERKRKFNEAWVNRDGIDWAGPHVPGSPPVFADVDD